MLTLDEYESRIDILPRENMVEQAQYREELATRELVLHREVWREKPKDLE